MAPVVERDADTVKVDVRFALRGSLLEMEEGAILRRDQRRRVLRHRVGAA
jgi:hypothetical protein